MMSSDKKPPKLSLIHLTVSNVQPGKKLLTSHLTDLGLISNSLFPPCKVDLELLCCCILFSNKGCGFIVSAVTSCTLMQKELLMLLMIMFTKDLLDFSLTPPALTKYSEYIWKLTVPSP